LKEIGKDGKGEKKRESGERREERGGQDKEVEEGRGGGRKVKEEEWEVDESLEGKEAEKLTMFKD